MLRWIPLIVAAALAGGCSAGGAASPTAPPHGDPARPVVLELFQSQGCSSCPPALAVLDQLAGRPDVLALNFAVTYWDQLGWKDRFAKPAFTQRQWDYARAAGRPNVATPQLIVNGRRAVLGSRRPEVEQAIAATARPAGEPIINAQGASLTIGAGGRADATVWLVDYDPRRLPVAIGAGENNGRTLIHRDIVRGLAPLGAWTGAPARYPLPAATPGLARAVLVQAGKGGPIVAAARL